MNTLLPSKGDKRPSLRALMTTSPPVLAPGCFDALSARLVEEVGFPAAYMTGYGSAATYLGRPDVGLMTMTEMVDKARRIADATSIPLIADADTGYGNAINVIRTVREYERAGVAAIHLEDQVLPKKCGHMENKQLVPLQEAVGKIKAAVDTRTSEDFLIIARTDARAVEGLEAAIERGHRLREAGADVIFVEAPQNESEIVQISRSFAQVPLLFNWAEGGKTPPMSHARLSELNFSIVIFPVSTMLSAMAAMRKALARIKQDGSPVNLVPEYIGFQDFNDFMGLPEVTVLEARYGPVK